MKTYRVKVWTGPGQERHFVAARVNGYGGLLAKRAEAGTDTVQFDTQAIDQVDAYLRVEDILTYVGLRSYARPFGRPNGVMVRELKAGPACNVAGCEYHADCRVFQAREQNA